MAPTRLHSTATATATATRRPATFATLALAAATALAAFGSQPVLAQPASPAAPATATVAADAPAVPARPMQMRMDSEQRQRMQGQRQEQRMERWQQRRAERMAAFKAQLQLTPAQESAWTDFTAAMQPGQRHARLDPREGMENLTAPERIDRMRALRIQRAAEADRRGEAVKAFYAALSAPQQKTFDARMVQMQKRMHRGGQGGPGAKGQRGDNGEAGGPGSYGSHGAKHHYQGMQRNGMQRPDQGGAAMAPNATAPAAAMSETAPPAAPAQQ